MCISSCCQWKALPDRFYSRWSHILGRLWNHARCWHGGTHRVPDRSAPRCKTTDSNCATPFSLLVKANCGASAWRFVLCRSPSKSEVICCAMPPFGGAPPPNQLRLTARWAGSMLWRSSNSESIRLSVGTLGSDFSAEHSFNQRIFPIELTLPILVHSLRQYGQ